MRKLLFMTAALLLLSACGYVSDYEKAVYDREPLYCYKTIGGTDCHNTPKHRDEKRLVNYFGPHPSRYEKPAPAPSPILSAPPPIDFYVRDPEPMPAPKAAKVPPVKVKALPEVSAKQDEEAFVN